MNNTDSSKTVSGIFYFITVSVVSNGASFIFLIAAARFLPTVTDLGILTILQTIIMTTTIIGGFGLPQTATRFLSTYVGVGQEEKAQNSLRYIIRLGLLSSAISSALLYLFSPIISEELLGGERYSFLIQLAAADSFFLSMVNLGFYSLSAFQLFRRIAAIAFIGTISKFSAASVFLLTGSGIEGIVSGFIIGDATTVILYLPKLISLTKQRLQAAINRRELLDYSLPWYGSSLLAFAAEVMDRYLLQILAGLVAVGLYTPAILFGAILRMFLSAMEQALLPHLSREFGRKGINSLASSNKLISRYIFLIYIPTGFLIIALIPSLIPIIYGEKYIPSILPSIIIVIGFTLPAIGYVFNTSLMSAGHTRIFLISTAIGIFLQLLVGFILIPFVSEVGAAIARSLAFAAMTIYPAIKLRELGGLDYDKPALIKGGSGATVMIFTIIILTQTLTPSIALIPSLFLGIVFYLLFLRLTKGVTVQDIEFLNNVTNNKVEGILSIIKKIAIK